MRDIAVNHVDNVTCDHMHTRMEAMSNNAKCLNA